MGDSINECVLVGLCVLYVCVVVSVSCVMVGVHFPLCHSQLFLYFSYFLLQTVLSVSAQVFCDVQLSVSLRVFQCLSQHLFPWILSESKELLKSLPFNRSYTDCT